MHMFGADCQKRCRGPLYQKSERLLDLLGYSDVWPLAYLQWEVSLLDEMGHALQLNVCAVTGMSEDLVFVSPKTGRAVSRAGAGVWADRLLPLPDVLRGAGNADDAEIAAGLITTGYFLDHHLAKGLGGKPLPESRARFVDAFTRRL